MAREQTTELSDQERLNWLRLIRSENVGPITFHRLLGHYGTASAALTALPELARKGGKRAIRVCPRDQAEAENEALTRLGGRFLASAEAPYPRALATLDDAPPLLAALGHPHLLTRPAVAMVGARNASLNGRKLAQTFARELSAAGFLVVSGLARGIDRACHEGSLADGTAAVLAGGVDVIYPPQNKDIYHAIQDQGLLLSEVRLSEEPQARHFPRRNRIISGLAIGTLVVEAAVRSGSLITARLANEQGREVFAIPGSPLDPRARGGNSLLKQGATLVEQPDDVLTALKNSSLPLHEPEDKDFSDSPQHFSDPELESVRQELSILLGPAPVGLDDLQRSLSASPALLSFVLLELELAGRLERHSGNRLSLLPAPS
ncbi:DNA-processing protein DprA [Rhodovibrionaceae bacterium A322]